MMSFHRLSPVALLVGLAVTATASPPAHGQTLLRWKFEPGQKSRLIIKIETQMKMVVQKSPSQVTSASTVEIGWQITDLDDHGVATLTQTVDRFQVKMQGPQGVMMEYDTRSDQEPKGMAVMMASVFGGMIGKSYITKMDPLGHIVEMKLPQGLAENMSKLPGGAQLGTMFSEEGIKDIAEIATLPEDAVNPGDTWTRTATMKNAMTGDMTVDTTFRYAGPEVRNGRELEKIAMEMKMHFGKGGSVTMKLTDQASEGTIYFDNELGQFVASESKSTMKMQMSVLGQAIEQEIETRTTTERVPQPSPEKTDD